MNRFYKYIFWFFIGFFSFFQTIIFSNDLSNKNSNSCILESKSHVNWITKKFDSNINIDVDKAQIPMPAGKLTAINKITTNIPNLVKDPILTLNIDSNNKLGDIILDNELTYHDIKQIISSSNCSLGYFKNDSSLFTTKHSTALSQISSMLVKHSSPYKLQKSIEYIASKKYSGIIIDARGIIGVHGEYMKDKVQPCFFPKIYCEQMDLIYEKNMVLPEIAKTKGICHYDFSDDQTKYEYIIGKNPLYIKAQKTFGQNRSDIIIKKTDALKIITIPENLNLLKEAKVVILLDKENLIYDVYAPQKDELYYTTLEQIQLYPTRDLLGPDRIEDGPNGIKFLYNLKFIPDSPLLLPEENKRIADCAKLLKEAITSNEFTIFVGGHTADIGQPENQMALSVARTQTIIQELIKEGVPENLFTYRGYGATVPATGGDNQSEQGRAVNRRVEITLRPKVTYIQRAN